jgi:hypothetical protein
VATDSWRKVTRTAKANFERETTTGKNGTPSLELPVTGASEPMGNLSRAWAAEIASNLRSLLADVFALYLKTKNFHWHLSRAAQSW